MTSRPMPTTLYKGPIISMKPGPVVSLPARSGPDLQRRAHTRRVSSTLRSGLSPVSEEDEAELVEDVPPSLKPRRRPRPAPLIPPRTSHRPDLPVLSETPDYSVSFQEELQTTGFVLSPSALLDRRPSETLFDFPIPPTSVSPIENLRVSPTQSRHSPSPTLSNDSFSSTCYPPTPQQSDDETFEGSVFKDCNNYDEGFSINNVTNMTFLDFDDYLPNSPIHPHRFRRTASSMSLRSFDVAELNLHSPLTHTSRKDVPSIPTRSPNVTKEVQALRAKPLESWTDLSRKGRLLSVVDTVNGSSFDVPLVLGSFLPCSPNFGDDDADSDREDIPDVLERKEGDFEDIFTATALPSSDEEEDSDLEPFGPSRVLDPILSVESSRRRRQPIRPMRPDTPSIYSLASFCEGTFPEFDSQQVPHGISATSLDFHLSPHSSECPRSPGVPASCNCSLQPELRSRFSSSTLGSMSEPTSTTSSFFARLIVSGGARSKLSSSHRTSSKIPTTTSRSSPRHIFNSNANSRTMRKASHIPTSPTPSSFSFSSHSSSDRERDYADDTSSCISGDSAGSNGLKRPPIPIELFIRA